MKKDKEAEEKIQNRQYQNLILSQEKEMRALHKHQIKDEKNLQAQQQKEQHILLKQMHAQLFGKQKPRCWYFCLFCSSRKFKFVSRKCDLFKISPF